ncbi:MAG: phospholipase D-like domain-containing protein [Flavobacteriales bacterium]
MPRPFRALLLLSSSVLLASLHAQPIQTARNAAIGSTVTFNGVITSGPSLGTVRYIQDANAGIALFAGSGSVPFGPAIGDAMTITGTLTNYNGLLEVTPITQAVVTSTGNTVVPDVVTPSGVDEAHEAQLVRVNGVRISGGGLFAAGSCTFSNGAQSAVIYLRSGHPLIGTPVPAGTFDVVGIVSQYDPTSPYTSGYQLLPRDADDLIMGAIAIVGPVVQANITTSGFDLQWTTDVPGTGQVEFGLTPALGTFGGSLAPATAHTASLTGLAPATFYYARAFSVNGSDTAFSDVHLYSTMSTSSGAIRVYFNKSVDTSVSSGTPAVGLFSATDDTIKAYIDRARSTLDIAMYNTSSTYLVNAVNAAAARGVRVRWIAEGSNANTALASLAGAIPVLYRSDGLGSGTHDKFMIVDAEDAANAWVMSGSPNWTNQSLFTDYNNLVFIQDQALARCYRLEFEEMWGGTGAQPVPASSRFGAAKTDNTPHQFNIGGRRVESFFSPTDGTTARIADALDAAQHKVNFALYVFTQNDLAAAMVRADRRPGVTVRGDMEDITGLGAEFNYLLAQGVDVVSHYTEPGLLHHKYAIIDESSSGDPLVITGSHNWTATAESVNDENTLVIHDATIANLYLQEWTARHNAVVGIDDVQGIAAFRVFPNPAHDRMQFVGEVPFTSTVVITDALGRSVLQEPLGPGRVVDVSAIAPGAYLLLLREARGALRGAAHFVKE